MDIEKLYEEWRGESYLVNSGNSIHDSTEMIEFAEYCVNKKVVNVPKADSVQPLLCEGWRDRSDKSYYNEKRILIFTPCYEDITMRWRLIDSQFMDLCTEASHWKKLDEPAFV